MKKAIGLIFTLFAPALAAGQGFMRGGNGDCPIGLFGGMGWFPMILIWGGIAFLLAASVKWLLSRPRQSGNSSLDIIKERFARGEISQEEYQTMKKELV
ncbi:MAG: SHOCT domain-containing protein [SAR324 cluster bacterium]|nr:SHOCT domain-containing protein [SAR324 cluster bacterium]